MNNVIPDSTVRFLKNVPFSNNYRNVVDFQSASEQTNYFQSLPYLEFDKLTYVRNNGALKVAKSKDEMLQYNYMMYQNSAFSNKYFYAFITNVTYISPKVCLVSFEMDVWQTWLFDFQFQPSYIERKHCKRWNEDGTPVINTIPESLDFGSEYQVKNVRYSMEQNLNNQIYWLVFATSLEYGIGNMIGGVPNLIEFMYYPISTNKRLISPDSSIAWGASTINGVDLGATPVDILDIFRNNPSYVNKIAACYVTDYVPFKYTVTSSSVNGGVSVNSEYLDLVYLDKTGTGIANEVQIGVIKGNKTRYFDMNTTFPNKYMGLTGVTESKLLMFPYSYVQLTDFQGNTFDIKNEYVYGNNISIDTLGSVEGNQKVAFVVNNYLNNNGIYNKVDYGIINAEPKNVTVIDDYSAAYLQGNANTIRQSITATQSQAALNNSIARNQASTASQNATIKGNADMVSATLNIAASSVGAAGSANWGNKTAAAAAAGAEASIGALGTANQVAAARLMTENTNLSNLYSTAARGELDNQLAIASSLAKVQDTRNVADTVHLQGGNTGFTIGNNIHGYALIAKQIVPEYINILTDYFQKYGYAYHRVETPVLRTRQNWDYIQTTGCNIIGNMPEMYIEQLQKLFDSGITIWHTTNVGNYNLPNNEI